MNTCDVEVTERELTSRSKVAGCELESRDVFGGSKRCEKGPLVTDECQRDKLVSSARPQEFTAITRREARIALLEPKSCYKLGSAIVGAGDANAL